MIDQCLFLLKNNDFEILCCAWQGAKPLDFWDEQKINSVHALRVKSLI